MDAVTTEQMKEVVKSPAGRFLKAYWQARLDDLKTQLVTTTIQDQIIRLQGRAQEVQDQLNLYK